MNSSPLRRLWTAADGKVGCATTFLLQFLLFSSYGSEVVVASESLSSYAYNSSVVCGHPPSDGITLASFRWDEIGVYFTITAFVIIAGFAKIGFHKLSWLSSKVPESCLLILLGLAVSILIFFTTDDPVNDGPCHTQFRFPRFTSEAFFFILLPPIILDSAYSLHDRVFLDNIGTILVFAVLGTLINVFAIGGTLYGVSAAGAIPHMNVTLADAFVFSSLISAVDPVAVLAIFQELGVNQNLYFLIFGESLLNDGVTVVLYNTMQVFRRMTDVTVGQYLLAILSFFIVSLGGIFIGIFYGILTSLVTKMTHTVRVVEPLALLGLAYLCYLSAELFHFSGIISLIVCGLIQAHYGFYNISQKSYICVKYFTKMASATCDTIIFMFLGMLLVNQEHEWNTAFVMWSLLFCLVYRFIGVFVLSAITNIYRTKAFGFEEQFIVAYGGLRGAVAFSLASTLDENMNERHVYIFTTLIVILFTVFVQGITIRPLVNLLKIQKKNNDKRSLCEEISGTSMDHIMAGIEEVMGHHGDFYLKELIMHYNDKYFKKWFLHEYCDNKLTRLFEKIALSEHYAHLYGPVALLEDHVKPLISYSSKERLITSPHSPLIEDEKLFVAALQRQSSGTMSIKGGVHDVEDQVPPSRASRRMSVRAMLSARKSLVSIHPVQTPEQHEDHALRKALRSNRYNKLHYTYNRNLVNDEDQELNDQLNRRTLNARRMSALASASFQSSKNSSQDPLHPPLPGHIPEKKKTGDFEEEFANSMILLERHKRRSMIQRERVRSQLSVEPVVECLEEVNDWSLPTERIEEEQQNSSSEVETTVTPPTPLRTQTTAGIEVEEIPLLESSPPSSDTKDQNV